MNNLLPADGEAYYYPEFFSPEIGDRLLVSLTQNIQWKQEPVTIMGKQIMQPRLTAWYGDEGRAYSYTGITMHPMPWIDDLLFIKENVEAASGQLFNSVLLNLYRNGQDSMGWHRDNEKSLGLNPTIGSVSFGNPRRFRFKHIKQKLKEEILLTHGSFLLMKGETQTHWLHSVPKSAASHQTRINLTFRRIVHSSA